MLFMTYLSVNTQLVLLHFNVQGSNNMKRSYESDDGTDVLDSRTGLMISETDQC